MVDALDSVSVGDVCGVSAWRGADGVGVVVCVEFRGHQCLAVAALLAKWYLHLYQTWTREHDVQLHVADGAAVCSHRGYRGSERCVCVDSSGQLGQLLLGAGAGVSGIVQAGLEQHISVQCIISSVSGCSSRSAELSIRGAVHVHHESGAGHILHGQHLFPIFDHRRIGRGFRI